MLELLTFYLFLCLLCLFNIKVSKDTGVPYKTTDSLVTYCEEETGWTFYFKVPFGLNKPIRFYSDETELTTLDYIYSEEELLKQDKECLQIVTQYQKPARHNLSSLQVLSLQTIASVDLYLQPKRLVWEALSLDIEYTPANSLINKVKYLFNTH